jgi:hypothetical protein
MAIQTFDSTTRKKVNAIDAASHYEAVVLADGGGGGTMAGVEAATGGADNDANSFRALYVTATTRRWNGAGWDKARNNQQGTLLASAARTATAASPDQTNHDGRGVVVFLNITAASGTGGLQVIVEGKDPVSGSYQQINATPAAVTATGFKSYVVYPGAASGPQGDVTQTTEQVLPRTWRVRVVHGDGSSYTYSVGYAVIQ